MTRFRSRHGHGSECNCKPCHAVCHLCHLLSVFGVVTESIPSALQPYPHKDNIIRKRKRKLARNARNGKDAAREKQNVARENPRRRGRRECHLFRALSTAVVQWYRFHAPPEEMRQTKVQNKEKGKEKKGGHHQEQARHPLQSKTNTTAFVRIRNKKRKNNPKTLQNHIRSNRSSLRYE